MVSNQEADGATQIDGANIDSAQNESYAEELHTVKIEGKTVKGATVSFELKLPCGNPILRIEIEGVGYVVIDLGDNGVTPGSEEPSGEEDVLESKDANKLFKNSHAEGDTTEDAVIGAVTQREDGVVENDSETGHLVDGAGEIIVNPELPVVDGMGQVGKTEQTHDLRGGVIDLQTSRDESVTEAGSVEVIVGGDASRKEQGNGIAAKGEVEQGRTKEALKGAPLNPDGTVDTSKLFGGREF